MKELIKIQAELNAPKGQYNSFGKYAYRSCEDILSAVKPLLKENKCLLNLTDEIELVGDRFYIKATASISNEEGHLVSSVAYAREEETKKGMDGSQITGTASSYARKYALNGLFLIDDTKDADTDEHKKQTTGDTPKEATKPTINLDAALKEVNACTTKETLTAVWDKYKAHGNVEFKKAVADKGKAL